MLKDFDSWNQKKKIIDKRNGTKFYHSRDIWWCALGVNVGFEQDGKNENFLRPVLIIKGLSQETCLIAPLTASKLNQRYRISIGAINGKEAKVVLSQIRVVDVKRLMEKILRLDEINFETIKKSLRDFL